MAAELKAKYPDAAIRTVPSRGGRFEVDVDGAPVFEKSKIGRHAQVGEVAARIAKHLEATK